MRPAGLSRTKRSHRVSVFLVPLVVSLTVAMLLAAFGPGARAQNAPTPAAKPAAAKPAAAAAAASHSGSARLGSGRRRYYRHRRRYAWHRRYRSGHAAVAATKPAVAAAAKPVLVVSRLPVTAAKAAPTTAPVATGAAGVATKAAAPPPAVHHYYRRRRRGYSRRTRVAPAAMGYASAAAALAAPTITPGGNLVEPLSNGLTFTMPRALVQARYGKPQEQVGAQMRYSNFGVEYLPNSDRVNFVALQHDVRLNSRIGTGSTKAEVEKVFGRLDAHDEVVYQKYRLHFAHTPDGRIDVITVAPAPGHPGF